MSYYDVNQDKDNNKSQNDQQNQNDHNSNCHGDAPASGPDGRTCDRAGLPSGPEPSEKPDPYHSPFP